MLYQQLKTGFLKHTAKQLTQQVESAIIFGSQLCIGHETMEIFFSTNQKQYLLFSNVQNINKNLRNFVNYLTLYIHYIHNLHRPYILPFLYNKSMRSLICISLVEIQNYKHYHTQQFVVCCVMFINVFFNGV